MSIPKAASKAKWPQHKTWYIKGDSGEHVLACCLLWFADLLMWRVIAVVYVQWFFLSLCVSSLCSCVFWCWRSLRLLLLNDVSKRCCCCVLGADVKVRIYQRYAVKDTWLDMMKWQIMLPPAFYSIIFHPTECSKTIFLRSKVYAYRWVHPLPWADEFIFFTV